MMELLRWVLFFGIGVLTGSACTLMVFAAYRDVRLNREMRKLDEFE